MKQLCRYRARVTINVHIRLQNLDKNPISVTLTMALLLLPDRLVDFHAQQSQDTV